MMTRSLNRFLARPVFSTVFCALAFSALVFSVSQSAQAFTSDDAANSSQFDYYKSHGPQQPNNPVNDPSSGPTNNPAVDQGIPEGQRELIDAQQSGRGLDYVEVREVTVTQVLPDDLKGSKHQKWIVQLANGRSLLSVYNISICERVPVKVGDVVSMAGQYIWDKGGGLIHWIHQDPRGSRKDGYVEVGGNRYGRVTNSQN
jgi:hypothetical protein